MDDELTRLLNEVDQIRRQLEQEMQGIAGAIADGGTVSTDGLMRLHKQHQDSLIKLGVHVYEQHRQVIPDQAPHA